MSHTLRKAFRDILEARRAVRTASVSNPASVRLAAGLGYEAAGPDAIFLSGISGAEQLRAIVSAVSLPVILGAAGPQLCDEEVLRGIGVSLWLQGHAPSVEAIHSMQKTYSRMKQNAAGGEMKSLTSDELVKDLVKAKRYAAWMNEYMKATSKFG
jgi:2-methylisocitrate lyase-like PEP mutase family enzyme